MKYKMLPLNKITINLFTGKKSLSITNDGIPKVRLSIAIVLSCLKLKDRKKLIGRLTTTVH